MASIIKILNTSVCIFFKVLDQAVLRFNSYNMSEKDLCVCNTLCSAVKISPFLSTHLTTVQCRPR